MTIAEDRSPVKTDTIASPAWPDGLRGLTALCVVLAHVLGIAYSTPGSPLSPFWLDQLARSGLMLVVTFIVLSGYLLTMPTVSRGMRLDSVAGYLARRSRRILPGYYAALIIALATAVWVTHQFSWNRVVHLDREVTGPLILQHDWFSKPPSYDLPLWSLAPEVHLYLLFPVMLWFVRRVGMPAGSIVLLTVSTLISVRFHHVYYLYSAFVIGMTSAWIVSTMLSKIGPKVSWGWRGLLPACLAPIAVWAIIRITPAKDIDLRILRDAWLTGVLLASFFWWTAVDPRNLVARFLTLSPLRRVGNMSYSLYLTHDIVLWTLKSWIPHAGANASFAVLLIAGVPLSLAFAYGFYLLFERPYLTRRRAEKSREILSETAHA